MGHFISKTNRSDQQPNTFSLEGGKGKMTLNDETLMNMLSHEEQIKEFLSFAGNSDYNYQAKEEIYDSLNKLLVSLANIKACTSDQYQNSSSRTDELVKSNQGNYSITDSNEMKQSQKDNSLNNANVQQFTMSQERSLIPDNGQTNIILNNTNKDYNRERVQKGFHLGLEFSQFKGNE